MPATESTNETPDTTDRIRLVTGIVSVDKDGDLISVGVSLRYDWQGPDPDHSCLAVNCSTCRQSAFRKAVHKMGGGTPLAFTVGRDGQSVRTPREDA